MANYQKYLLTTVHDLFDNYCSGNTTDLVQKDITKSKYAKMKLKDNEAFKYNNSIQELK